MSENDATLLYLLDVLIKTFAGNRDEFSIDEKPFFQLLYEIQAGAYISKEVEAEYKKHRSKIDAALSLMDKKFSELKPFRNKTK